MRRSFALALFASSLLPLNSAFAQTDSCIDFKAWRADPILNAAWVKIIPNSEMTQLEYRIPPTPFHPFRVDFISETPIKPGVYRFAGYVYTDSQFATWIRVVQPEINNIAYRHSLDMRTDDDGLQISEWHHLDKAVFLPGDHVKIVLTMYATDFVKGGVGSMRMCMIRPLPLEQPSAPTPGAVSQDSPVDPKDPGKGLKLWYEHEVVKATAGYDPATTETMISSYNLTAIGPADIGKASLDIVKQCVEDSTIAGVGAFKATPSPEIGARIAAAWTSFHLSIEYCMSPAQLGSELKSKFEIGWINRVEWVDGIVLKFNYSNPATEQYKKLQDIVKDKVPEPINKVLALYIQSQELPKVDITLQPPPEVKHYLAQLPPIKDLQKFAANAQALAGKDSKQLIDDAIAYAKNEAQKRITDEWNKNKERIAMVPVQLEKQVADEITKAAPSFEKSVDEFASNPGKALGLGDVLGGATDKVDECAKKPLDCPKTVLPDILKW